MGCSAKASHCCTRTWGDIFLVWDFANMILVLLAIMNQVKSFKDGAEGAYKDNFSTAYMCTLVGTCVGDVFSLVIIVIMNVNGTREEAKLSLDCVQAIFVILKIAAGVVFGYGAAYSAYLVTKMGVWYDQFKTTYEATMWRIVVLLMYYILIFVMMISMVIHSIVTHRRVVNGDGDDDEKVQKTVNKSLLDF